ncbi:ATP-binding protein [Luedemannella helvata]|uniref:NB-ARC domain-containing protein n=1 Tax=Luedemannella helvata TaxID=349315 RepID=A0ABP4WXA3_9ACTN
MTDANGKDQEPNESQDQSRLEISNSVGVQAGSGNVQHIHLAEPPLPAPPLPRQLPRAPAHFTGRRDELEILNELLSEPQHISGSPVLIAAVAGTAGVGKTALALHWAHSAADQFPDGQLYLNMRGYDSRAPMTESEALGQLLRALGVAPKQIPTHVEEQEALYRSLVADQRLLIVFDNVGRSDQVTGLLPGTSASLVLITSRSTLPGLTALENARRLMLDVLSSGEAVELLGRIIGTNRTEAEIAAARRLVEQCAFLPLAIKIAAERVSAGSYVSLADAATELLEHRLDDLSDSDDERARIRAVFSWSYNALDGDIKESFRLLGLHTGSAIDVWAMAALLGQPLRIAQRRLKALQSASLLEEPRHSRFRMHDLLRLYAQELLGEFVESPVQQAARRRLAEWYLYMSEQGDIVLNRHRRRPPVNPDEQPAEKRDFKSPIDALNWFEFERINLVEIVRDAKEHGLFDIAWRLPLLTFTYFRLRSHWVDYMTSFRVGLQAAKDCADEFAEAWLASNLGIGAKETGQYDLALVYLEQAIAIRRRLGDAYGEGQSLHHLAGVLERLDRQNEVEAVYLSSMEFHRVTGNRYCEGATLLSLGEYYQGNGLFEKALLHYRLALAIHSEIGYLFGQGHAYHLVASIHERLDDPGQAIEAYQEALDRRIQIGHAVGQAETLERLGHVMVAVGRGDEAAGMWREALVIFDRLGDIRAEGVRALLESI